MRSGTVSMPVMIIFEDLSHVASRSCSADGFQVAVPAGGFQEHRGINNVLHLARCAQGNATNPPSASAEGTHQRRSSPSLAPADGRICNSLCSRATLAMPPPGRGRVREGVDGL